MRREEMLLGNMTRGEFDALDWSSKRRIDCAYDDEGKVIPFPRDDGGNILYNEGLYAVFVSREEYISRHQVIIDLPA